MQLVSLELKGELIARIVSKFEARRGGINWILRTDPRSFEKLLHNGAVCMSWQRCHVREFVKPLQCFRGCKKTEVCKKCGQ